MSIEKMYAVIEKLANGEHLEAKYRDHELIGNYMGVENVISNLIGSWYMRL